jgi:hypothetical protein
MPLRNAEATDPTLDGITTELQDSLHKPAYSQNPHQCFANLDSDPLVPDLPSTGSPASRLDLLRHIHPQRGGPIPFAELVVNFSRLNTAQGPITPIPASEVFGRVQSLSGLLAAVSPASGSLGLNAAKALIRDLLQVDGDASTRLAVQKFDLTGKLLSKHLVWAYPASSARQPFDDIGTTRAEAVNALGLGYYAIEKPDDELVRWAHRLPPIMNAQQPTVWDANTSAGNVYWRPWGKTCQLASEIPGVTEVVHSPIRGEDLIHPIEELT